MTITYLLFFKLFSLSWKGNCNNNYNTPSLCFLHQVSFITHVLLLSMRTFYIGQAWHTLDMLLYICSIDDVPRWGSGHETSQLWALQFWALLDKEKNLFSKANLKFPFRERRNICRKSIYNAIFYQHCWQKWKKVDLNSQLPPSSLFTVDLSEIFICASTLDEWWWWNSFTSVYSAD